MSAVNVVCGIAAAAALLTLIVAGMVSWRAQEGTKRRVIADRLIVLTGIPGLALAIGALAVLPLRVG